MIHHADKIGTRTAFTLCNASDCYHYCRGDDLIVDEQTVRVDDIDHATGVVWVRALRWYERAWRWLRRVARKVVGR